LSGCKDELLALASVENAVEQAVRERLNVVSFHPDKREYCKEAEEANFTRVGRDVFICTITSLQKSNHGDLL
jgi:hypothetical protein